MMTLALPEPAFPEHTWDGSLEHWHELIDQARTTSQQAGTGHRYPPLLAEARELLEKRDVDVLRRRMRERLFARAVAEVWATNEHLATRSMTTATLGSVAAEGRAVSRLATHSLISALLGYFDRLDDWEEGRFEAASAAVARATAGCRVREAADVVEVVRSAPQYVSQKNGPRALARDLISQGRSLEDDPVAAALCGNDQGRFAQVLRNEYYLGLIADADPSTGGHTFLDDATARATVQRRDDADHRFGIAVLTALCDKPGVVPNAQWVDAVLTIGGDPRHEQSATWHEWWAHVDADLRARAVRWMSGADLRAFLDAVEVYGNERGNASLQRMFPRRQRFLLGLYESGLVQDVRLILGNDIRTTVSRVTSVSLYDAPVFDDQARDTAVVFIDCGDFHLVEGSHNFRLHLYLGAPGPELSDPLRRSFTRADLIHVIPDRHRERHPRGGGAYDSWTHDQGGNWVRGALDYLRANGIDLHEPALLTKDDLALLTSRRRASARSLARFAWRSR